MCVKLFLLRIELTRLPDAAPRVPSFGAAEMTVKRRMGAHENLDAFLTAQLAHMLLVKSFRIASSSGTCRLKKKAVVSCERRVRTAEHVPRTSGFMSALHALRHALAALEAPKHCRRWEAGTEGGAMEFPPAVLTSSFTLADARNTQYIHLHLFFSNVLCSRSQYRRGNFWDNTFCAFVISPQAPRCLTCRSVLLFIIIIIIII